MRVRQHVNPLGGQFAEFRGELPPFDARPVEVEIGCADAQFLFERASLDPTRLYVGLEIREDLVLLVNRRAKAAGVPVHAVFCHAQLHIPQIFAPASVDRVFVNFPDPWFKARHHNRRMVDAKLAEGILHMLRPSGELFFQTDVWELATCALESFELRSELTNRAGAFSFWKEGNPYGVRSWREQNAAETGLTVWRLLYTRSDAG